MSFCKLMDSFKEPGFAEKYKRIAEGITSKYAVDILKQAGLDKGGHGRLVFLDSACGTGIVSAKLIEMLSPVEKGNLELTCGDFAEPMVEFVRNRMQKEGWKNAKAEVIDINVCSPCVFNSQALLLAVLISQRKLVFLITSLPTLLSILASCWWRIRTLSFKVRSYSRSFDCQSDSCR